MSILIFFNFNPLKLAIFQKSFAEIAKFENGKGSVKTTEPFQIKCIYTFHQSL